MKIVLINLLDTRSTGKICKLIGKLAESTINASVFYIWKNSFSNVSKSNEFIIEKKKKRNIIFRIYYHFIGKYIDYGVRGDGFVGIIKTKRIIKHLKKIKPDIIHLHNIHGGYCNLRLLFNYIKKQKIPVVFTAHDCWMITGCCPYFLESGCNQYITNYCKDCNYIGKYPLQYRNIAHKNLMNKVKYVGSCKSLTIITCSRYLESLFKNSYLSNKNIKTIHNGVDVNVFRYIDNYSNVFKKYKLKKMDKYVLAIADYWSNRKGDYFISKLSKDLEGQNISLIIIGKCFELPVGTTTSIIDCIDSQEDMACFYSGALVLANPTLEDNYPTVLLETICCGTPAVTFDTGGCSEIIEDEKTGFVVDRLNYKLFLKRILSIAKYPWDKKNIRDIAINFANQEKCYLEYINIYGQLTNKI